MGGNVVVEYKYDAWGNCVINASTTNTELANINPFRYRSYYFDTETGLYYLQSRYYDPEIGRFISPDNLSYLDPNTVNGLNLYAYCLNNPANNCDPSGHFVITLSTLLISALIAGGIGAGIGLGSAVYKDLQNGQIFDGDVVFLTYVGFALGGFVAGTGIGISTVLGAGIGVALTLGTTFTITAGSASVALGLGAALTIGMGMSAITGALGYTVRTAISNQEDFEWSHLFIEAGANAVSGMISFASGLGGGILGNKIPGSSFTFGRFLSYQQYALGGYGMKVLLSWLKNQLKGVSK